MNVMIAVLGSAAIGALVSSSIAIVGQWLERSSRQRELLLARAADMAINRVATVIKLGEGKIEPDILMVEDYYVSLKHLMDHGRLDDKTKNQIVAALNKDGMALR